jgi:hypothetical protein
MEDHEFPARKNWIDSSKLHLSGALRLGLSQCCFFPCRILRTTLVLSSLLTHLTTGESGPSLDGIQRIPAPYAALPLLWLRSGVLQAHSCEVKPRKSLTSESLTTRMHRRHATRTLIVVRLGSTQRSEREGEVRARSAGEGRRGGWVTAVQGRSPRPPAGRAGGDQGPQDW